MEQTKKLPKDRLLSQREKKVDKLKNLKADAEHLKQSLTTYKTESKKHDNKHDVHHEEKLYELVVASGISVDRDVLEQIVELLRLDVNPDKLFDMLQVLTKLKKESEIVSVI